MKQFIETLEINRCIDREQILINPFGPLYK